MRKVEFMEKNEVNKWLQRHLETEIFAIIPYGVYLGHYVMIYFYEE